MSRTFIDIHVIQNLPPSNLNRDDTGSPKSAIYGGVRRARVSSQAWKRAMRKHFEEFGTSLKPEDLGIRTKRWVEVLSGRIVEMSPDLAAEADTIAEAVLTKAGVKLNDSKTGGKKESGYLLLLGSGQQEALAQQGIAAFRAGALEALQAKDMKKLIGGPSSLDLALFGRMVADDPSVNVDAAAQVAHALSVHEVANEFDYFTAVDDSKDKSREDGESEDAGAGMIGTVEFNSSTLYRYATVNVEELAANVGSSQAAARGLAAFVRSFVESMPTGKQNTFANRTLPAAVVVSIRQSTPVSYVGAFEEPVQTGQKGGYVQAAISRLVEHAQEIDAMYGSKPEQTWVMGQGAASVELAQLGTVASLTDIAEALTAVVAQRVPQEADRASAAEAGSSAGALGAHS